MFRPTTHAGITELLARSHGIRTRADIWRGSAFLGSAPVLDGALTETADQFVTGVLDLDVSPKDERGVSWVPSSPLDPLNVYGQRISLNYEIQRASGAWLSVPLGWYVIDEWESAQAVSVSGLDVRDVLRTARLLGPTGPAAGGTFVSELRRLVGGRLPLDTSQAPANRAVPGGMVWEESRTDAIDELLKAWPARLELDADGALVVLPDDLDGQPADVELVDGDGGTVVGVAHSGSRDGLYNVVVARGEDPDSTTAAPVVGYATDTDPSSPTYVDGPMGELVTFFSSPLLRTVAQCSAAARTILARSLRQAVSVPVTTLPDPRIGVNTRVDLTLRGGTTVRTVVTRSVLPLSAAGGAQQLVLGVIPGA